MNSTAGPSYIIIQGITENGRKFRPSDWAERIAGLLARTDRLHRMQYSTRLLPLTVGGIKAVAMDQALEQEAPLVFQQVMGFAISNQLLIIRPTREEIPQAHVA